MTNPNSGAPVQIEVPEVLTGSARFTPDIDAWDETTSSAEHTRMAHRLATELDHAAEYGRALWHQLEKVAAYLREDIAHGELTSGVFPDDEHRNTWAGVYAATLSVLAGPRGDSGFGAEQARLEMQHLGR